MPKWTEYTTKETLADNDEVMLYDATGKANKRGLMSKFWDYVVDKMATAVISKLETENKTVIGALNYLNNSLFGMSDIGLPKPVSGTENIIENCKYLCSLMEPFKPYIITGNKDGRAAAFGFTYEKSYNTNYARFIYLNIGSNIITSIQCFNGVWETSE